MKSRPSPLIEDAACDYQRKGMASHAAGTRKIRKSQLAKVVKILGSVLLGLVGYLALRRRVWKAGLNE